MGRDWCAGVAGCQGSETARAGAAPQFARQFTLDASAKVDVTIDLGNPMSAWIHEFAERERQRRASMAAFQAAVPAFCRALAEELHDDVIAYRSEFPADTAEIVEGGFGGIDVICSAYHPASAAHVRFDFDDQTISCDFEHDGRRHPNWQFKLRVLGTSLDLEKGQGTAAAIVNLSKSILLPLFFPGL